MESTKHTPGPWIAKDVVGAGWEIFAPIQKLEQYKNADGNFPVWTVPTHVNMVATHEPQPLTLLGYAPWCQFPPAWWLEMIEANAQLMAAAPELLDALEAIVASVGEQKIPVDISKAKMAIAKAKGEKVK